MVIKIFIVGFLAVHILRHLLYVSRPAIPDETASASSARITPSRLPLTLIFPVSVKVKRALHQRNGFVMILQPGCRGFQTGARWRVPAFSNLDIRANDAVIIHVVSGAMRDIWHLIQLSTALGIAAILPQRPAASHARNSPGAVSIMVSVSAKIKNFYSRLLGSSYTATPPAGYVSRPAIPDETASASSGRVSHHHGYH